ncbi:MAG: M24 family metallopeptidase C-terminal domain-containing protein, partial [Rickettsiales bacterium]|nr:M24 family metallopeptidase C-terminal domain-containing protein [Rickettsiales bacterium]
KRGGDAPLRTGMVVSNEPGFYKAGEYGIRIENLVAVVDTHHDAAEKRWFSFDTLTCAPIDTRAVDVRLMTQAEKDWLNAYHAWVLATLKEALDPDEQVWLQRVCKEI